MIVRAPVYTFVLLVLFAFQSSADLLDTVAVSGNVSHVTIVLLGGTGDLAMKKLYSSLLSLVCNDRLDDYSVIAVARKPVDLEHFQREVRTSCAGVCPGASGLLDDFLSRLHIIHGNADVEGTYHEVSSIAEVQSAHRHDNRLFYLALPPFVFHSAASAIKRFGMSPSGWNRVVVEKPFGHDAASSRELIGKLAEVLTEDQQYRIDHYLGKEVVQGMLAFRFANPWVDAGLSARHVEAVHVVFKEPFGVKGRAGYFDAVGIIRDVMQNHLLQVLSLTAMDMPLSNDPEAVRDAKVELLKAIRPIAMGDVVLGQYGASTDGASPAYLDDHGGDPKQAPPADSPCSTYARVVLWVDNDRWSGVPFVMTAAKAVETRVAEVRVVYKAPPPSLFKDAPQSELRMEIQPNDGFVFTVNSKTIGLEKGISPVVAEVSLHSGQARIPGAYERLLLDVLQGDHSHFVRSDELAVAWDIFTPMLRHIDAHRTVPHLYPTGSRGPAAALQADLRLKHNVSDLHVYPSSEIAQRIVARVAEAAAEAIEERGRFVLGLSGGSHVALLGKVLVEAQIDWRRTYILMVDERYVEESDAHSNMGAWKQLFEAANVECSFFGIVKTSRGLQEDANTFERALKDKFDDFSLDLAVLGIGPDGHTASLFPNHRALDDKRVVVAIDDSPKPPSERVTLTSTVLANAKVLVVATGENKSAAIVDALSKSPSQHCPVCLLRPVTIVCDSSLAAAALDV